MGNDHSTSLPRTPASNTIFNAVNSLSSTPNVGSPQSSPQISLSYSPKTPKASIKAIMGIMGSELSRQYSGDASISMEKRSSLFDDPIPPQISLGSFSEPKSLGEIKFPGESKIIRNATTGTLSGRSRTLNNGFTPLYKSPAMTSPMTPSAAESFRVHVLDQLTASGRRFNSNNVGSYSSPSTPSYVAESVKASNADSFTASARRSIMLPSPISSTKKPPVSVSARKNSIIEASLIESPLSRATLISQSPKPISNLSQSLSDLQHYRKSPVTETSCGLDRKHMIVKRFSAPTLPLDDEAQILLQEKMVLVFIYFNFHEIIA